MENRLQEVIKTLIDESINIDLKVQLMIILEENEDLIKEFKVKAEYQLVETKTLLDIQIKEYCIINICSYLDEYEKYFNANYIGDSVKIKISETKKILKPFIREIKRNYDLKDYRNHILAHNLRDNSSSLIMGNISRTYNFPKYTKEFVSINEIIRMIMSIILNQFQNDLPDNYWEDRVINSETIILNRTEKIFDVQSLKKIRDEYLNKKNNRR